MNDHGQPGRGWTVVLRRQPNRIVEGRPEGGYTDAYELVCCDCGDDPDLDYRGVSPKLQQIRGPYPFAMGITAYQEHVRRDHERAGDHQSGRPAPMSIPARSPAAGELCAGVEGRNDNRAWTRPEWR